MVGGGHCSVVGLQVYVFVFVFNCYIQLEFVYVQT